MDMIGKIDEIKTREEFIAFLNELEIDNYKNESQWENRTIQDYLKSIYSWVEDMDGYYSNMHINMPDNINWSFIATLFYVGKIYE